MSNNKGTSKDDQQKKKEQFFEKASDLRQEKVPGMEEICGFEIYARELTPDEQDNLETQTMMMQQGSDQIQMEASRQRAKWVRLGAVDEDGNQIFDATDEKKLGECSPRFIEPIFEKIQELSQYTEEDMKELGLQ